MLKESSHVNSKLINFLYCQFVLVANFTLNSCATSIPLTVCAITRSLADRLYNKQFNCTTINSINCDFARLFHSPRMTRIKIYIANMKLGIR